MARKTIFDTLLGNFFKHFLTAVFTLYMAEISNGLDPFHFDVTILKKFWVAGIIAAMPTILNWMNPNDPRFGKKGRATFKPENNKIKP